MESFDFVTPARQVVARGGVVLLLVLAVGCGRRDQAWVSGQVLYKGQPVTGGIVTFFPADNRHRSVATPIDENGRYQTYLPFGDVKIAVDNRELEPAPQNQGVSVPLPQGIKIPPPEKSGEAKSNPAAPKRPPGVYVAIPEEYYDVRTSGLTYTVQPGSQTHDIVLPEVNKRKR
jgi:hypothetical protein